MENLEPQSNPEPELKSVTPDPPVVAAPPAPPVLAKLHDHDAVMNSLAIIQQHFAALNAAVKTGHALNSREVSQAQAFNKVSSCRWIEEGVGNWLFVCA